MGTSTMGGDLHSDKQDKLLKLQARKKELELMLASKNEELYKLCVQEVQLTGVMPPEAPLSPADVQDGADRRRARPDAKHPAHRLSTPAAAPDGAPPRRARRVDSGRSNFFPSPPQERHPDTFCIRAEPPRAAPYRHPAEPHFSSSQPDIARHTPLLYQYAAQLRAHSQHLGAPRPPPPHRARRVALQRTQTYHLTSHSDYSQHLDAMAPHEPLGARGVPVPSTLPLRERAARPPPLLQLQGATDDYSPTDSDSVSTSRFSPLSPTEGRAKEKQWYETSLDAPALRKSGSLKRAPPYELMGSAGRHVALSPGAASLEAPGNVTVIEQGRCIPYREETKPFEMSDFYKYSTKFRQASAARPAPRAPPPCHPNQWH
ncbi:FERM domain-containing protein 4A [Maniola hyperantus]|uniref:FERM domain-containing protein 4A n=1 Tax=Aphantopus hyperantus TaxID=2795564 RepID=UPI001567F9E5|nr:FERM domain-containing protein 4A [Maniola hyperantus]